MVSDTEDNARQFLQDFVTNAALSGSQMDKYIDKLKQIPVISVHQSKGCEFDTVIIAGADSSNFPSYAARQNGSMEEEKRVFYVAISRAKKKLIMTHMYSESYPTCLQSPYINKIPKEYIDFCELLK